MFKQERPSSPKFDQTVVFSSWEPLDEVYEKFPRREKVLTKVSPAKNTHRTKLCIEPKPTLTITPTMGLEVVLEEGLPKIMAVEYNGTADDVQERISEQNERILALSSTQRTPAETMYAQKHILK